MLGEVVPPRLHNFAQPLILILCYFVIGPVTLLHSHIFRPLDDDDEEIPSDSDIEEEEEEAEEQVPAKKIKLSEFPKVLANKHKEFQPYRSVRK